MMLSTEFICSNSTVEKIPKDNLLEYAFIGRSNVGKSTFINALTNQKKLARTSNTPGKTLLINHFLVNKAFYLVDLPGYGYAKISKKERIAIKNRIHSYLLKSENLVNIFLLIDLNIKPQTIDLQFMSWLGHKEIPFSIIFSKIDKLKGDNQEKQLTLYKKALLEGEWLEFPKYFCVSSYKKEGVERVTKYILKLNAKLQVK